MQPGGVGYVILGFLQKCGPLSGYEVKALVDSSTRFFWAASYGQIYPELRRLEAAGLIEGESSPRGERRRNVYTLTAAGGEALVEWLRRPDVGTELRDLGLLKLFFAGPLEGEDAVELVRRIGRQKAEVLERLRAIAGHAPDDGSLGRLVLEFGIELHEFFVDWWERAETRLSEREEVA